MPDRIDASSFTHSLEIYEIEFKNILTGITICYKLMIKKNVLVPANDENLIRDMLLLNYLKNRETKSKAKLTDYRFDREIPEDTTKGRVDIRIISKNDFEIDEAYYIIECKRLNNKNRNGTTGLNAEYIKNGILRFVGKKYTAYYRVNGMIGFVVEQIDIGRNIENINTLLKNNFKEANTKKKLMFADFINNFKHSYSSVHENIEGKEIKLYHLMFDFSKNLLKTEHLQ